MRTTILFSITLLFCISIYSKDNTVKNKQNPRKVLTLNAETYLDINNVFTPVFNNGKSDANSNTSAGGLVYPIGSGKTVVYSGGILWGAFVSNDPQVRVGGATYNSGLQAGIIKPDGTADEPTLPKYRAYRVRPDVYPGGPSVDLTQDAIYENTDAATLRTQYEADWNEWPADEGAPYTDVNHNGTYEPGTDIPGVPGADQTIWYVCNDLNSTNTQNLYGTQSLGIELQTTIWAYKQNGVLNNAYFKKYKIINKGSQHYTFDSTFISLWADPDLGNSADDYCGTDSTLGLIYTYNGSPEDAVYYYPPTLGFYLVQGLVVNGKSGDTAFVSGRYIPGKKNLPMTASYFFINGNYYYGDPPLADPSGSSDFYNFFNGKYGASGLPFQDPFGNVTKFVFPGDPVTGSGWIESQSFTPNDIRQGMASGPINMAPGDTQEVVYAEMITDKLNPVDSYLTGITNLKNSVKYASLMYRKGVLASIFSANIVNIGTPVTLSASTLPNNAQVVSINWSLQKPSGSSAVIANSSAINTSFTPDLAGDYKVTFTAAINGLQTSDVKTIKAVNNRPPVAALNLDKTEITSIDSVYVKYNECSDPDGDSLSFNLTGNGMFNYQNGSKAAYFYPTPGSLGNETISLIAADLYSCDSAGVNIKINPWMQDIKVNYSYIDTAWITGLNGPEFFEGSDTLYVPTINSLKRYSIKADGIEQKEELTNLKITGIFAIDNNLLYASSNTTLGIFGTVGKLSVYDLSNNGAALLTNYLPGSYDIISFYKINSDYYLRDNNNYIYKMDFSNIASHPILATSHIELSSASLIKSDDQYLYFLGITNGYNYYVKILDRANLTTINTLTLPFNITYTLVVKDTILVVYQHDFLDSLYIYSFDYKTQPVLLKEINLSSFFANPFPYFYSTGIFNINFMDNYLEVRSYSSTKLLDISDLNNIKVAATCLGCGMMDIIRRGNNYYLINGDPRYVTRNNPYSGINAVTLDKVTGIDNKPNAINLPAAYVLNQNYPNPFNPSTVISYSVPKAGFVTIKLYDVLGREVATLCSGEIKAGSYKINYNAGSLASGVYYYKMKAGDFTQVKKMMLLK